MAANDMFASLSFQHGPAWKSRLALAPLTNQQSHADGTLSEEEFRWLTMRAEGGFAMVMTAAAHVQACGQGFPGQLGVWDDRHIEGLTRLADAIRAAGSVSSLQLHHAGIRADKTAVKERVGPSDHAETGSRALSLEEVAQVRDDFIAAAKRAEAAGFDGAEIHGAHGYILAQFMSPDTNQRGDEHGGSVENRTRLTREIIDGIRAACGPDFQLGIRLSPERFGLSLPENVDFVRALMAEGKLDYIDLSLWDYKKLPDDENLRGKSLLEHFTDIPRHGTRLGGAGKIRDGEDIRNALEAGLDFALIGRAGILHHDLPRRVEADAGYMAPQTPVSVAHMEAEGVSPVLVTYLRDTFRMVEPL